MKTLKEILEINGNSTFHIWKLPKSNKIIHLCFLGGDLGINDIEKILFTYQRVDHYYSSDYLILDLNLFRGKNVFLSKLMDEFIKLDKEILLINDESIKGFTFFEDIKSAQIYLMEVLRKFRSDNSRIIDIKNVQFDEETIMLDFEEEPLEIEIDLLTPTALLIVVKGEYPVGSLGDECGTYLFLTFEFLFRLYNPSKLIIDMSSLSYQWGDRFEYAPMLIENNKNFPFRLIISDLNSKGIFSLATNENRFVWSMEEAIKQLDMVV